MIGPTHFVALGAVLFALGLYGALVSRSLIRVVLCVELMLNAVNVNLVAFSHFAAENPAAGVATVVLLIVVSAAEVGLALALIVALAQTGDISAIESFRRLGESGAHDE